MTLKHYPQSPYPFFLLMCVCLIAIGCSPVRLAEKGYRQEKKGNLAKAMRLYPRAMKKDQRSGLANYRMAIQDLKKGNFRDTLKALDRIDLALDDPKLSRQRGVWHHKYHQDVKQLQEALHYGMAYHWFSKHQYPKTFTWLKKIPSKSPSYAKGQTLLASARLAYALQLADQKQFESALKYLGLVLGTNPHHQVARQEQERTRLRYANEMVAEGNYPEAISLYETVLAANPTHIRAKEGKIQTLLLYAQEMLRKRHYSEALVLVNQIIRDTPKQQEAYPLRREIWLAQAHLFSDRREYADALESLSSILEESPSHPNARALRRDVWWNYARNLRSRKKNKAAIYFVNALLVEKPYFQLGKELKGEASFDLAKHMFQSEIYSESISYLDTAILFIPELLESANLRKGWAYFKLGNVSQAIAHTIPLRDVASHVDTASYHLARYFASDDSEDGQRLAYAFLDEFYERFRDSYDHFRLYAERELHFPTLYNQWRFKNWVNKRIRITLSDIIGLNIPDEDWTMISKDVSDPMVTITYDGTVIASSGYTSALDNKVNLRWPIAPITFDFELGTQLHILIQDHEADVFDHDKIASFYLEERHLLPGAQRYSVTTERGAQMTFGATIALNQGDIFIPGPKKIHDYTQAYINLGFCAGTEIVGILFELSPYSMYWDILTLLVEATDANYRVDWETLSYSSFEYLLFEAINSGRLGRKLGPVKKMYDIFQRSSQLFECFRQFNLEHGDLTYR